MHAGRRSDVIEFLFHGAWWDPSRAAAAVDELLERLDDPERRN